MKQFATTAVLVASLSLLMSADSKQGKRPQTGGLKPYPTDPLELTLIFGNHAGESNGIIANFNPSMGTLIDVSVRLEHDGAFSFGMENTQSIPAFPSVTTSSMVGFSLDGGNITRVAGGATPWTLYAPLAPADDIECGGDDFGIVGGTSTDLALFHWNAQDWLGFSGSFVHTSSITTSGAPALCSVQANQSWRAVVTYRYLP